MGICYILKFSNFLSNRIGLRVGGESGRITYNIWKQDVQRDLYFKPKLTIYKLYDLNHGLISLRLSFFNSKI